MQKLVCRSGAIYQGSQVSKWWIWAVDTEQSDSWLLVVGEHTPRDIQDKVQTPALGTFLLFPPFNVETWQFISSLFTSSISSWKRLELWNPRERKKLDSAPIQGWQIVITQFDCWQHLGSINKRDGWTGSEWVLSAMNIGRQSGSQGIAHLISLLQSLFMQIHAIFKSTNKWSKACIYCGYMYFFLPPWNLFSFFC